MQKERPRGDLVGDGAADRSGDNRPASRKSEVEDPSGDEVRVERMQVVARLEWGLCSCLRQGGSTPLRVNPVERMRMRARCETG
jgi:hypothetical protein